VEKYSEWIRVFHDHGIALWGSFMFGLDHDTKDIFEKTVKFCSENHLELVNFLGYTPYPGTPLYERAKREGRLLKDEWWLDPPADVMKWGLGLLKPKLISMRELTTGISWANQKYYSLFSAFKQLLYTLLHTSRAFSTVFFCTLTARKKVSQLSMPQKTSKSRTGEPL